MRSTLELNRTIVGHVLLHTYVSVKSLVLAEEAFKVVPTKLLLSLSAKVPMLVTCLIPRRKATLPIGVEKKRESLAECVRR